MHLFLYHIYLIFSLFLISSSLARKQPERVLLSSIKTLTLRQGLKAAHNRASPIPQLKCVGGTAKGLYDIDVLRCKNAGSSYDDVDVEWTCTASLPSEFKLGSTDVTCEGYTGPDDPYVLKGSCGVEYRLMLTRTGEEKYRNKADDLWDNFPRRTKAGDAVATSFWLAFIAVLIWMIYAAFFRDAGPRQPRNRGGLGGWGGGGGDNDPPPPYDPFPPRSKPKTYAPSRAAPAQQGWRPGFWTGAVGGALGGYMAGNRGNRAQQEQRPDQQMWGNGESSSNMATRGQRSGGSSYSSSSAGSTRHESTGFGGTSRR